MKKFEKIESEKNAKFKIWLSLHTSRGIKKHQKALVAGKNQVSEIFELFYEQELEVLFTEKMGLPVNLGPNAQAYELSESLFKQLDPLGLSFPLLVVPLPEIKTSAQIPSQDLEVYLPLGDPKNLGAALRNCLAFGIKEVILLKEAAHPFHPHSIKASSGACFKMDFYKGPSIKDLKSDSQTYVLDGKGQSLKDFQWPVPLKLIVGEEGQGVPESLKSSKKTLSIPISPDVESLNAHQALGIALYDYWLKQ